MECSGTVAGSRPLSHAERTPDQLGEAIPDRQRVDDDFERTILAPDASSVDLHAR